MFDINELNRLSQIYGIPNLDILLIALNRYGLIANLKDSRVRFKIMLNGSEDIYYIAVCLNTYKDSPFKLENESILFNGTKIGHAIEIEKDTCDSTYFRRNRTELTLNSNARSECKGCKFCGTYNQEKDDMNILDSKDKLRIHLTELIRENNMIDLSEIVRVTVCTGCFKDENKLVEHLIIVHDVLKEFNFNKRLRYIGSQIRSKEAIEKIRNNIPKFSLSITVECFERRNELMREEKSSLTTEKIIQILKFGKENNFSVNFLYIIGLDNLEVFRITMKELSMYVNRFPVVQILQNYSESQEGYRDSEAREIEYYLKARKILEEIFKKKDFKPRCWENYRGLFYSSYQDKRLDGIKI